MYLGSTIKTREEIPSSSRSGAPLPMGGMIQTVLWAQQRAEAKQAELIGMTSVAEVGGDIFSRAETVLATFEAEQGLSTLE
eukprot:SAG22_NODE_2904_length_2114_cov_1.595533_3_plen_81_part_00